MTLKGQFVGILNAPPATPITLPDIVRVNAAPIIPIPLVFAPPAPGSDGSAEWLTYMMSLYTAIRTTLIIGGASIPIGVFTAFPTFITPTFTRASFLSAYQSDVMGTKGAVIDAFAKGIMADLRKFFLIAFPATYVGAYTGTTTINSVITP